MRSSYEIISWDTRVRSSYEIISCVELTPWLWHAIVDFIMHIHIEENCPFIRTETSYLRAGNIFIYARSYLCIENTLIYTHRKHAHIYTSKTRSYLCIENTLIFMHRKHAHIYASKTRSYLCIENTLIFMHRKTRSYLRTGNTLISRRSPMRQGEILPLRAYDTGLDQIYWKTLAVH